MRKTLRDHDLGAALEAPLRAESPGTRAGRSSAGDQIRVAPGRVAGQAGPVDGAATAATAGRSAAGGDTQGCTFVVDRVQPPLQDVSRRKVTSASAMF